MGFVRNKKNVQHLIFGVIFVDQVSNFTANKGHPFEGPRKRKNPTTKFQLSAELRPKSEGLNLSIRKPCNKPLVLLKNLRDAPPPKKSGDT